MKFSKIIYSVCALGSVLGLSAYAADFGPGPVNVGPARVAAVQNMGGPNVGGGFDANLAAAYARNNVGGPDFARAAALQNMGGVSPMEVAQAVQKANAGLPLNGRDVQALQAYQASQTLRPGLVGPGMTYYANNAGRRLSPAEVALFKARNGMDLDLDDVRALQALQTRRANVEAGTAAFTAPGYFANPVAGYNFMNRNQGPDFDIRGRDLSPAEVALLRQYSAANAATITTDAYGTNPDLLVPAPALYRIGQ
jgi:hypothetical protein